MGAPNRCLWTTELNKQANKQWQHLQHTKAYRWKQPNSNIPIPYKVYEIKVNGHHQIVFSSILFGFQRANILNASSMLWAVFEPIRIWYRVNLSCVCYVRASLCNARSLLNFVIGKGKEMRQRREGITTRIQTLRTYISNSNEEKNKSVSAFVHSTFI